MAITTAMSTSFKSDLMSGLHCFNANVTPTGDTTISTPTITNLSALTGVAVGMGVSGTGIAADTVVARILSGTSIELSKDATATNAGVTLTLDADEWKAALITNGETGTYDATTSNYTDVTGNTDEVTGTGYTAGGEILTNVSPTTSGTTAYVDFADVSWTTATFSTNGCILYNNTRRGPVAQRSSSVHDFSGTQTVTAGTFTIIFPTADASNAILRLG